MTKEEPENPFELQSSPVRKAPPPLTGGSARATLEEPKPKKAKKKVGATFEEERAVAMVRGDKLFNRKKAEVAVAELLVRVLRGMSIDESCSQIGLTVLDYHFLLREFPDFRHRLQQAMIDNALRLESKAPALIAQAERATFGKQAQIAKIALDMIMKHSATCRKLAAEIEGEMGKESPKLEAKGMTKDGAPVYDEREDREYNDARRPRT